MHQSWQTNYQPAPVQPNMANGALIQNADQNPLMMGPLSVYYRQHAQHQTTLASNQNAFGLAGLNFPVDQNASGRSFLPTSFPTPYSVQQLHPSGAGAPSMQLPHQSMSYPQNYLFTPQMLHSLQTGLAQCQTMPTHPHHSMQVQAFDTAKHFGSLQHAPLRRNRPTITSKTNLYVSGLTENDNDETLRSLVEDVVQPKSCKAMMSHDKCKGFGFIDCATEEDAERAKNHIETMRSTAIRKLSVKYAFENEKDAYNVYVRNLPKSCNFSKVQLEELFKSYGNITSAKILEKESGPGVGFVRFSTESEAATAIDEMNRSKRILPDNMKPVTCKLADKADPNRRSLAATRASQASGVARMPYQVPNNYLRHGNNSASSQHTSSSAFPYSAYESSVSINPDAHSNNLLNPSLKDQPFGSVALESKADQHLTNNDRTESNNRHAEQEESRTGPSNDHSLLDSVTSDPQRLDTVEKLNAQLSEVTLVDDDNSRQSISHDWRENSTSYTEPIQTVLHPSQPSDLPPCNRVSCESSDAHTDGNEVNSIEQSTNGESGLVRPASQTPATPLV